MNKDEKGEKRRLTKRGDTINAFWESVSTPAEREEQNKNETELRKNSHSLYNDVSERHTQLIEVFNGSLCCPLKAVYKTGLSSFLL